jgi:hypothetical protein
MVFHGWAIVNFIRKIWSDELCDWFCKRLKQQFDFYGDKITFYYWLPTFET